MAIEEKKVTVYGCDGCTKKVMVDGTTQPSTGIVGTVVLTGTTDEGPFTAPVDWFAHSERCIRAAVVKAADTDPLEALAELVAAAPTSAAADTAGRPAGEKASA